MARPSIRAPRDADSRRRRRRTDGLGRIAAAAWLAISVAGCRADRPSHERPAPPAPLATHEGASTREAERPPEEPATALLRRTDLRLAELLRIAEQRNPEIAAAREELGAAAGRTEQSGLYPNPVLELEAEEMPASDVGLGGSKNTVGLAQPLVVGARRRAAVSAAAAEERVRFHRLEATRRAILAEVRAVHGEALALRASAATHEELLAIARRTLRIAEARFEARAVPETEVIRAELEVHELELGVRRLEEEGTALAARLRALLGGAEISLEQVESAPPADPPAIDPARLGRALEERNPELAAARAAIEAADLRIDSARARRVPDVVLELAYGQDSADENVLELGLGVPLPVFDRDQGRIREARHLAVRARREAEALEGRLAAELADALAAHAAARAEVRTFRETIVPATERSLAQVRESYEAGRTDLLNLLDAQRSNARARLSLVRSRRDAGSAEARLWKLVDLLPLRASTEETEP